MKNSNPIVSLLLVSFVAFGLGWAGRSLWTPEAGTDGVEGSMIFAIFKGEQIFGRDVLPLIKDELRQIERSAYELKKNAVRRLILSKQNSVIPEVQVDRDEFAAFLKQRNMNVTKMTKHQRDDAIGNFKNHKIMLAARDREQKFFESAGIEWHIPMPFLDARQQVGKGFLAPLLESSGGPTVVVFANFHCPHCPEAFRKINALRGKYDGRLNLHFRFSMAEPPNSMPYQAAVATACANEQGKFKEFFANVYSEASVDLNSLNSLAGKSGLDQTKFESCMVSEKARKLVQNDISDAEKTGFPGAAMMFVNGRAFAIQESLDHIEAALFLR